MKKILFVLPHMLCGGVERSFLALADLIPRDRYEITLLLLKAEGKLVDDIPKDIKVGRIPIKSNVADELMLGGIKASFCAYIKGLHIIRAIKLLYRVLVKKDPLATLDMPFSQIEILENEYDIAICYHIHMPFCLAYVAEKVNAQKKYAWIHNDFSNSHYSLENKKEFLQKYDHFFAVSDKVMKEFQDMVPELSDKISVAFNIISDKQIIEDSKRYYPEEYKKDHTFKILTIARLETQKGIDLAVTACKNLLDSGYSVSWYVLGDGSEKNSLMALCRKLKIEDSFHLLGIKKNPYPYIAECDLYVQPSRHEGYGIAVAEARVLYKPVICTDFAGAREQIVPGKTGEIIQFDQEELVNAIKKMIDREDIKNNYINNLKKEFTSTEKEFEKILDYL